MHVETLFWHEQTLFSARYLFKSFGFINISRLVITSPAKKRSNCKQHYKKKDDPERESPEIKSILVIELKNLNGIKALTLLSASRVNTSFILRVDSAEVMAFLRKVNEYSLNDSDRLLTKSIEAFNSMHK